ncbi:HYR domain-containing protein [Gillisia marina]|uniref:HYR domain-containing protein n=1 Tax=Gillisia marina TaxID=1167637 RepID=UPI00029A1575|nr:HYR domain-containing protein [Gillisia marina]
MLFSSWSVVGQNQVQISSPQAPGPTDSNPIEVLLKFKDAVNSSIGDKLNFSNGTLISENRVIPDFENFKSFDLPTRIIQASVDDFLINFFRFNPFDFNNSYTEQLQKQLKQYLLFKFKDLIVAFDVNDNGEMFYLTFGNGVFKYNSNGEDEKVIANEFESPIDLLIDKENRILVADSDAFSVKVFSPIDYSLLIEIGGFQGADKNEFYGPTGLAVDSNNQIYVADTYAGEFTGPDPNNKVNDKIKVYKITNTSYSYVDFFGIDELDDPFRLTVDSKNNIYVSDSGGTNGRIRIFDSGGSLKATIASSADHSPASISVDSFGYIYVADYDGDITFNGIYQNPLDLLTKFNLLKDKTYAIDVYKPLSEDYKTEIITSFNSNLKLPIDLTLNQCENIFVLDLDFSGEIDDADFDFDIEAFRRNDIFRIQIEPTSAGLVTVALKDINFFKCDPQPAATFSVEYRPDDNTPPEANCKPVTLFLNADGNATLIAAQVYDGDAAADNVTLSIDKENFDCSSLGENVVTLTVTGENGEAASCGTIIKVEDNEEPIIMCTQDIEVTASAGDDFAVVEYPMATATDNCSSILVQTGGLGSGSEFPIGTSIIEFTASDPSQNNTICTFTITVNESPDIEEPEITCPDNIIRNTDSGECGAVVTFLDATATDNSDNVSVSLISDLPSGSEFSVGTHTVSFEAKDAAGNTSVCNFTITVIDNEDPTISCPNAISETVAFGESGKVITYTPPIANDNCSETTIVQTEGLASGSEFLIGTTTNTFEITDANGNTAACSFDITISESLDNEDPLITCPTDITQNVDSGECGAIVTFANASATDDSGNVSVRLISNLPSGSEFPVGTTTVIFEAEDSFGNTAECSFEITVLDTIPPKITCPSEILVEYTTDKTYTVPDFSSLYSSSDNCSTTLSYFQTPAVGTVITEDRDATFRVGDENNNFITCNFNIKFINSADLQITNCLGNQTFEVGNACEFTVPDYASTITANDPDAVITQSIPAGTVINNALPITITATLDGQTATCEFQLLPKDSINPVVICPGDQNETFEPSNGFSLPNYALQAQASDNCEVAKIEQIPDVGTVIFEDTQVTIRIEDATGNFASCTFNVILTEENTANTPPVAINDTYSIAQDMTLSISAPGVLENDSDAEQDELTAIIQSSTSNGDLVFNSDGSFSYTPNSGFTGEDTFTYVVNDGFADSAVATVTITITATTDNTVVCKESIILELDENGIANLNAAELFTARPEDLQFSVSQEVFTCDELGENIVTLSYSNTEVQGSCNVTITVKDVSAPILNVKDISIALNQFGSITITPEMLDNGSTDNCENLTFSLSKLTFGCKDLGENTVTFTATDSSENFSSTTAIVRITGNCEIGPGEEVEYIFIYPNPTLGPFQFATPLGVTIQRVEAYDSRGRMIMFKEYSEIDLQYNMDLSGVQNAVYILKLFTSEGIDIKRVIIN